MKLQQRTGSGPVFLSRSTDRTGSDPALCFSALFEKCSISEQSIEINATTIHDQYGELIFCISRTNLVTGVHPHNGFATVIFPIDADRTNVLTHTNLPPSRTSIDALGDALRDGQLTPELLVRLDNYRQLHRPSYDHVINIAVNKLKLVVTGRPAKSTTSIRDKLCRESVRLSQMQDIAGCRTVVEDIPAQDRAAGALEVFLLARTIDRRTKPSHGYRAVHLVASNSEFSVEIQVRTRLQHLWAEISEKLADLIDPEIKYGKGDAAWMTTLRGLSRRIEEFEREEKERHEALLAIGKAGNSIPKKLRKNLKKLDNSYRKRRSRLLETISEARNLLYG